MTTNRKKKAFTLTELLVVVIVIGVLSAVVLPKFSKVIETRKTTEAEEMMAFVRTEQERRCALDKPYAKDLDSILPNLMTKSYKYTQEGGKGISAQSRGKYGYTLKMPSYADGRICCENQTECEKLNKNYPLCSDLVAREDYVTAPQDCIAESFVEEEQTSVPLSCSATPVKRKECSTGCGWEERSATCNSSTGEWEYGEWTGSCEEAPDGRTETCSPCGETRTSHYACNSSTGSWEEVWDTECKTEEECSPDCCAEDFQGDFQSCILEQYGYDSPEYICAFGASVESSYFGELGSGVSLDSCARVLLLGSSFDSWPSSDNVWKNGGYKNYACTHVKPCGVQKYPKTETCNLCGVRSAEYTCNNGVWNMGEFGECSVASEEECYESECTVGETKQETIPTTCGTRIISLECVRNEKLRSDKWQQVDEEFNLKSGAECMSGMSKSGYSCGTDCKWAKYSNSGGGGTGSSGGGSTCVSFHNTFTDLTWGSFCNLSGWKCGSEIYYSNIRCI